VTAALSRPLTLSGDELHVLARRVGVHELPIVLALRTHHGAIDERDAAFDKAARDLQSRSLIVDGEVQPDLVPVLQALQRPDREFAVRLVTPDGIARISVVRRGPLCVLARRVGSEILVRIIGPRSELQDVATALVAELPDARPADIEPVGAPLADMAEGLSGTRDPLVLADRIRALGTQPQAAMLLGTALGSRQAFAEIVYYALAHDEGRIRRVRAAVAVFYTHRGRIVGVPSASPTGELWTTLKPGSNHAIADAMGQLVALSDERWAALDSD
jgi:hypothetical protein